MEKLITRGVFLEIDRLVMIVNFSVTETNAQDLHRVVQAPQLAEGVVLNVGGAVEGAAAALLAQGIV